MKIQQKRASNKATFEFREDVLHHSICDASGRCAFSVDYEVIPEDFSELEERPVWLRSVGVLCVLLGLYQVFAQSHSGLPSGFPFWFVAGAGFLAYYRWSAARFKIIDTPKGRIFVISGRDEGRIFDELKRRKADQIVRRYARILDPHTPDNDAARFNWLRDQQYISQETFEELMIDLRLAVAALEGSATEG